MTFHLRLLLLSICSLPSISVLNAQFRVGTGAVDSLYQSHCAVCHAKDLTGAIGSSLVDDIWSYGSSDADLKRIIENGLPNGEMTPWKDILSSEQIRSLIIYLREQSHLAHQISKQTLSFGPKHPIDSSAESFIVEPASPQITGEIWSIISLPNQEFLIANKNGDLRRLVDGNWEAPIKNTPAVKNKGQGGLLGIALHPNFPQSNWIYLTYAHALTNDMAMTRVVRGQIIDHQWTHQEVIFSAAPDSYRPTNHHFGSRIVFQGDYLFFSIGERGFAENAQDLSRPNGKIHRLHLDGSIPADNPFVNTPEALPSIWSYGHRNPQGLAVHPQSLALWETEHGPRGGDEVNIIQRGNNYGWPEITFGMNYNGTPITDQTSAPGMEQPVHVWVPSIAPCGLAFYTGDQFPHWENNLFAPGLASEELHRLVIKEGKIQTDEIILKGYGRIRDVTTGSDGNLYLSVVDNKSGLSQLLKLSPAKK